MTKKRIMVKQEVWFQVVLFQSGGHEISMNLSSEIYHQCPQNTSCLVQPQNLTMPIPALRTQVDICLISSPSTSGTFSTSDTNF